MGQLILASRITYDLSRISADAGFGLSFIFFHGFEGASVGLVEEPKVEKKKKNINTVL